MRISLLVLLALAAPLAADVPRRTVATFSIVAYDPANGDLGVAVSSKVLAVGAVVPWARAGVGAIATQAYANTTFGPRGLALLAAGKSAREALDTLIQADPQAAERQLAIVDAKGGVAVHSGARNMAWAGSKQGPHHTCQGNILAGEQVVAAMDRAYRQSKGELAERLLSALVAGQQAGGDKRGRQSAAILVVRNKGGYGGFDDRYIDLRVDDHPRPVAELQRILGLRLSWNWLVAADRALRGGKLDQAAAALERCLALSPGLAWAHYLQARLYAVRRQEAPARKSLARAIEIDGAFRQRAAQDPAFAAWREDEAWARLLRGK